MRKGFLHVVESLIVIMLVFVVLSQFYSIPRPQHAWSENKLRIMAQDMLYVLDEMQVDWLDASDIENTLSGIAPAIGYSVRTKQSVLPVMKIGCVCEIFADYQTISNSVLTDFTLNGIYRDFQVDQVYPLDFDLDGPHLSNYDVLLFRDFPALSAADAQNLSEYLRGGNGVVEYASLTQAQAGEAWHRQVFGLQWSQSTRPPDTNAEFQIAFPPSKLYDIKKLYEAINGGTSFSNFGTETVFPAPPNEESRILLKQTRIYTGPPNDGRSVPLAVINWNVYGNGRSAWMSNGTLTDAMNRDILKALVIWTAADKEYEVRQDVMLQSAKASFRKVLNTDMYELMWVELTVGYQF